jgi:endoglucanase
MMRSILLIALMAVLSFATPVSEHGKLSVSNGKIVDKNNNPFVLRGMSMFWNKWTEGSKYYNEGTVTTLAGSSWNANVVRVAAGDDNLDKNVNDTKNFMDWTATAGIYVIADWHYHTISNNAESFFTTVASYAKQKNYTHVIYEIFNEPCSGQSTCGQNYSWTQIKDYSEKVIDKIRAQDPDGLIVVGTPSFSSDIGAARANPITGTRAKNILYTLHFYTSDVSHNTFQGSLKTAYCNNFPIFATEWGTSTADGGADNKAPDWPLTNGWMSLVESIGISWANWSYTDKCETASALCGGLSASGKYVQRIMKNRNSGGSITSANGSDNVNLSQQNIDCGSSAGTGEKTGIVKVGTATTDAVNFLSMSGAKDSTILNSAPVLQNTASTFSVGYKLTDIPGPGAYRMRIRYGGAAATVSWQGSGLESGSSELSSSNNVSTWKNSDYIPITVTTNDSETPLNLTFNANGTNNFAFVNIQVSVNPNAPTPSSASTPSSSSEGATPIALPQAVFSNSLNAMQNSVNLQVARDASVKVFDLKGNMARSLKFAQGSYIVSLGDLPKGLYIVKAQFGNQREILRVPVR